MGFPIQRFIVAGKSMEPALHEHENVLVFCLCKGKVGDIVVAQKNAKTIIKRITKIERGRYTLKGDHWEVSTDSEHFGAVSQEQIVGKVIYHWV